MPTFKEHLWNAGRRLDSALPFLKKAPKLFMVALACYLGFCLMTAKTRNAGLENRRTQLEAGKAELDAEVRAKLAEIHALTQDPYYVERVLRRDQHQLGAGEWKLETPESR